MNTTAGYSCSVLCGFLQCLFVRRGSICLYLSHSFRTTFLLSICQDDRCWLWTQGRYNSRAMISSRGQQHSRTDNRRSKERCDEIIYVTSYSFVLYFFYDMSRPARFFHRHSIRACVCVCVFFGPHFVTSSPSVVLCVFVTGRTG